MGFLGATLGSVAQNFSTCPIFNSGMVLQRDVVVPIWGTADVNAKIKVEWNGISSDVAVADANGKWKVSFPETNYGGPHDMTFYVNDEVAKTYTDVYFGEVFYCSGQSNMELEVKSCNDFDLVKAAANDETIRQMKVAKGTSYELSETLPAISWKPATSAYVGDFSAAAYFCMLELKKLDEYKDIPFGILNNSYGGARVEAWMSKEMLGYDAYDITLAQGEKERQPTLIYNKMVHPLIGIPFKAMLWYQAESNCDVENDAKVYGEQFNKMISSYRNLWNYDFPVVWVQLPNYKSETRTEIDNKPTKTIATDSWITMRNEQTKSLSILPKSAQIVTIDAGLAGNIHPTDKQTIGTRLALAVRKLVYGDETAAYSPILAAESLVSYPFVKNEDGSITIYFDNVGDGLCLYENKKVEGNKLQGSPVEGDSVSWFQIVDVKGNSSIAKAKLVGNTVVVEKGENDIASVYYAWNRCPGGLNLYSKVGDVYLPVTPFSFEVGNAPISDPMEIQSFTASKPAGTVEGGTFVTFSWKTTGPFTSVYFNGEHVSPVSSAKVMLSESKDYVLKVIDTMGDFIYNYKTDTIHFDVVSAKPTIKLTSKSGLLANPGDEIEIQSNAAAPGGFNVTKVVVYVDDVEYETLTKSPFATTWTAPQTVGEYKLYGVVYNNNSDELYNSAKSDILTISVTDMKKTRFEAEDALLKGSGTGDNASTIKTDEFCSGEKYYDLRVFKQLVFSGINAPEDGDYQICIAYMANYCSDENPTKEQYLYANTTSLGAIEYTSWDWDIYKTIVPLKKGENTITIKNSWGWMSFDYIDILGVTNSKTAVDNIQGTESSMSVYCDTQSAIVVNYTTSVSEVSFEIFDMNGKKLTQVSSVDANGYYSFNKKFEAGLYAVKMYAGNEVLVQQVLVK